jgi:hypothetical protein
MTQDDVIKLAREAGFVAETSDGLHQIWYPDNLYHFAHLVAEHTLLNIDPSKFMSCQEVMEAARLAEREACARVADNYSGGLERNYSEIIADAIRARGQA